VIGCVVNGPGEAREAVIGVAGGRPNSIYIDGSIQQKARNEELVDRLEKLVRDKLAQRKTAAKPEG
ncbi:MAG: flavodoxin-dependent (E)-4-hydroxy-3-methylbut-2-enyl-diphosphate synthase, partial [Nevskiales bacterium]